MDWIFVSLFLPSHPSFLILIYKAWGAFFNAPGSEFLLYQNALWKEA